MLTEANSRSCPQWEVLSFLHYNLMKEKASQERARYIGVKCFIPV